MSEDREEVLKHRWELLREEAQKIRTLFEEPHDWEFVDTRIWDGFYGLEDGTIHSAYIVQRAGRGGDHNMPQFGCQINAEFGMSSSDFTSFSDDDATPEHIALFLRLDLVVAGYAPTWKERSSYPKQKPGTKPNVAIVRGNIDTRRLH